MKGFAKLTTLLCIVCCLNACRSTPEPDFDFVPEPQDKLTQKETNALVWHASQFVSNAKKVRLTKQQRQLIQTQKPEVKIKYLAPKYGHVRIKWTIADNGWVEISGTGTLDENCDFPWKLEVKILEETDALDKADKKRLKR